MNRTVYWLFVVSLVTGNWYYVIKIPLTAYLHCIYCLLALTKLDHKSKSGMQSPTYEQKASNSLSLAQILIPNTFWASWNVTLLISNVNIVGHFCHNPKNVFYIVISIDRMSITCFNVIWLIISYSILARGFKKNNEFYLSKYIL